MCECSIGLSSPALNRTELIQRFALNASIEFISNIMMRETYRILRFLDCCKRMKLVAINSFKRLRSHMSLKKAMLAKMVLDWERELRNVRRWEEDIRDLLKYGSHIEKISTNKTLSTEYITKLSSLFINLEMIGYNKSLKGSVFATALQLGSTHKITPVLDKIEQTLMNDPLYNDIKEAGSIEQSNLYTK